MSTSSDMFEELAPELAPADPAVADQPLVGMWAYREGSVECLVWKGTPERGDELGSAVETALWLFDDRREEGASASISMSDGIVVIEHGERGVLAAWYADGERVDTASESISGGLGLDADTAAYDSASSGSDAPPSAPGEAWGGSSTAEPAEELRSSESLQGPPESVEATRPEETEGGGQQVEESASRNQSRLGVPDTSNATESSKGAHRRSQSGPTGEGDLRSTRSSARPREDEMHSGAVSDPGTTDVNESSESAELNFEIAFVEETGSKTTASSEPQAPVDPCSWRDAVEHLAELTEQAGEHLGDTVTLNYWREAIDAQHSIEESIDVEVYAGLDAREPEREVEPDEARQLEAACTQWLRRCHRSVPSDVDSLQETPRPPWNDLLGRG